MEFSKVIAQRRAVRKYRPDPVPGEQLSNLFEALRLAPSANNSQRYQFIFISDYKKRREIVTRACHQEFILEAPLIMVAYCEPGFAFDVAIAVDHLVLAATNEGLGTCWVGWFERDIMKQILEIPENMEVPILIPIGYAAENPDPRPRKMLAEIIREV